MKRSICYLEQFSGKEWDKSPNILFSVDLRNIVALLNDFQNWNSDGNKELKDFCETTRNSYNFEYAFLQVTKNTIYRLI